MNNKPILILSQPIDLHARAVMWGLKQQGHPVHWWDRTRFPNEDTIAVELSDHDIPKLEIENTQVALTPNHYRTIWNRRGQSPTVSSDLHQSDKIIARTESRILLEGLMSTLESQNKDALVLNPSSHRLSANSKLRQLVIARRLGLNIPATLITNDPTKVRNFYRQNDEQIVAKMHIPYSWRNSEGKVSISGTIPLRNEDIQHDTSLKGSPVIYQELIESKTELRVIVFGQNVFTISQTRCNQTKKFVDLRWEAKLETEGYQLPPDIRNKCLKYLEFSGLNYAAIDILVTRTNEYVFLEANESGQFLFLEDEVPELPLLDAFCQFLASGKPSFRYTTPSHVSLETYNETADAKDCERLFEAHWETSEKSSPFELPD